MPIKWFTCPDNVRIETDNCLNEGGCRMGDRCASRPYLQLVRKDRPWTGKPSTTQLIQGTLQAFLKITKDYAISPDDRAFMIHGTKGHKALELIEDDYSFLEEKFNDDSTDITGIADTLEIENGKTILSDTKTSGSYKVAKALGFVVVDEPIEGEFYKSGKRKGEQKTRKVLTRDESKVDRKDWELQLNKYRLEYEKRGYKPNELRIMCIVRDGNTYIARSRGVFRNVYYFKIDIMPDNEVINYFEKKRLDLLKALKQGYWKQTCTAQENWDGVKCQKYCEVAEFCTYGKYLKQEREVEDMAIKGLSEVRRLPRLGKIRLGIKKKTAKGVEYPAEVDYFILAPQTPSELENKKLQEEFIKLYGDQPKSINIMFPVASPEVYFPQFYKRYGSSTSLKCKGDGEIATCVVPEFANGLEIIGQDEMGLTKVKCHGKECIYYKSKECTKVGVLQILLPEMPGAGVWQIPTGSGNSMININSSIDYITTVCGRAHMIPLKLERRMEEIIHEGKKTKHYILHVDMNFRLIDLQKFALIDPTRMLLDLPAPDTEKEDILFEENVIVNVDYEKQSIEDELIPPELQPSPEPESDDGLKITAVKKKEGTSRAGEPYTRFEITDSEGTVYKTFSESFATIAKEAKEQGLCVKIESETNDFGNDLVNIIPIEKKMEEDDN